MTEQNQMFFGELKIIQCASCHMHFGITPEFQTARRNDHKVFTCPNGHNNVYNGQSEAEKLRRENERLKQQHARKDDEIEEQRRKRTQAEHQTRAYKGVITKVKKRVGNGTCPCCNRHFQNLSNHMKNMHPEYHSEEVKVK